VCEPNQYKGYQAWLAGELIQNALPDLTAAQREILMTGIGNDEWSRMFREDE
jgi:hypothetical protein